MRIDPHELVAEIPILRIRAFFGRHKIFSRNETEAFFDIDGSAARQLLRQLADRGLIHPYRQRESAAPEPGKWALTLDGSKLAMATTRPPIARVEADAIVYQLVARMRELRDDGAMPICVARVTAIGSYAGVAAEVGDIDLLLTFCLKTATAGVGAGAQLAAVGRLAPRRGPVPTMAQLHRLLEDEAKARLQISPHLSFLPPNQIELMQRAGVRRGREPKVIQSRMIYEDPSFADVP